MTIPLTLPISPMLAKSVPNVPAADAIPGGYAYEPKWDGFRCIVIRDGDDIELASRGKKALTRYFPELVELVRAILPSRCIVDAEIVVRRGPEGAQRLDWESLSQRIHPAESRIIRLSRETPAELVCFDLLALADDDLTQLPQRERRVLLEGIFASVDGSPGVHLTRMTTDEAVAVDWFTRFEGAGLDGVVAKPRDAAYEQGKRTMLKIKHKRTAEAVVIGYRWHKNIHGIGSLLLGMYDDEHGLVPVGGIGAFSEAMRIALVEELEPLVVRDGSGLALPATNQRSRFSANGNDEFVPLEPALVVEVAFDQLEGRRFRHAVTFLRWRPDRDPEPCPLPQVDRPIAYDLSAVISD